MTEIEYIDAGPDRSPLDDEGVAEHRRAGGLGTLAVVAAVVAAIVVALGAFGGDETNEEALEDDAVSTTLAPPPPGVVVVDGAAFFLADLVDPESLVALPYEFEAVDDFGFSPLSYIETLPRPGGWWFERSGVLRAEDFVDFEPVAVDVDGVDVTEVDGRMTGASWGDAAAVLFAVEESDSVVCGSPGEQLVVAHTLDGGGSWRTHEMQPRYPSEFDGLGSVSAEPTVAVSGDAVAVLWTPRIELSVPCIVRDTELEPSDVARPVAEGLVLSATSGRAGEIVPWADLGVDVTLAARLTDFLGWDRATLFHADSTGVTEHEVRIGQLDAVDDGFVVTGWTDLGEPYVEGLRGGALTELPATRRTLVHEGQLRPFARSLVADVDRSGEVSFDGGQTFVATGLQDQLWLSSAVELDGEWFGTVTWRAPPVRTASIPHDELDVSIRSTFGDGRFGVTYGVTVAAADGTVLLDRESTPATPFDWADVRPDGVDLIGRDGVVASVDRAAFDTAMGELDRRRPVAVPLLSHRDVDGVWSHQPVADALGIESTAAVAAVFEVDDAPAVLAWDESFGRLQLFLAR